MSTLQRVPDTNLFKLVKGTLGGVKCLIYRKIFLLKNPHDSLSSAGDYFYCLLQGKKE